MRNWLAEPPFFAYVLLLAGAILAPLAGIFLDRPVPSRDGKKAKKSSFRKVMLAIGAVAAVLLIALRVCDYYLEGDREQIVRKLKLMSDGVRERNMNKVFEHVSESFHYNTAKKADLRASADSAIQFGRITSIPLGSVNVDPIPSGGTTAIAHFVFTLKGASVDMPLRCRAHFTRDPDNEWRLKTFQVFPATGESDEYTVPGL